MRVAHNGDGYNLAGSSDAVTRFWENRVNLEPAESGTVQLSLVVTSSLSVQNIRKELSSCAPIFDRNSLC